MIKSNEEWFEDLNKVTEIIYNENVIVDTLIKVNLLYRIIIYSLVLMMNYSFSTFFLCVIIFLYTCSPSPKKKNDK